ncbi:hypothetical protein V8E51_009987 [Hyaloscypha variabilis]
MYPSIVAVIIPLLAASVQASTLNGPCTGSYSYGICETIDTCNYYGGAHIAGYCPDTPTDVECCYNIENCVSSDGGEISSSCEWKSEGCGSTSHAGTWVAGTRFLSLRIGRQSSSGWKYTDEKFNIDKCPGGSTFECCAISAE